MDVCNIGMEYLLSLPFVFCFAFIPFYLKTAHRPTPFGASRCVFAERILQCVPYIMYTMPKMLPLLIWCAATEWRR